MSTRSRIDDVTAILGSHLDDPVDSEAILEALTSSASISIPGFEEASVSIREADGEVRTLTASDELARQVDALQHELREGPGYDVVSGVDRFTTVTYMDDDQRWPRFGPRAAELGVGSMMSFELTERPGLRSALNLYSRQGGSLEPDAVAIAQLFAAHAATTLGLIARVQELETALRTRSTIGAAVGIIMERYGLTHDRAFGFLVRLSNDSNVKLRDIAGDMVGDHDAQLTGDRQEPDSVPTP